MLFWQLLFLCLDWLYPYLSGTLGVALSLFRAKVASTKSEDNSTVCQHIQSNKEKVPWAIYKMCVRQGVITAR